jgi:hypothetical protein
MKNGSGRGIKNGCGGGMTSDGDSVKKKKIP